jgi:hypothetical protein
MIELSKCPHCASEDRVTIAGKDFCMRCGTPSQNTTGATSDYSNGNPNQSTIDNTANSTDQNKVSVTKFSDPIPATQQAPVNDIGPQISQQPSSTNVATPVANSVPSVNVNNNTPNLVTSGQPQQPITTNITTPQEPITPSLIQPQIQSQTQSPNYPIVSSDNSPQQTTAVNNSSTNADNLAIPTTSQVSQNNLPTVQQPELSPSLNPNTHNPISMSQQQGVHTPDPVQIPTDQPLTQPSLSSVIDQQSTPAVENTPQIHAHEAIMNLDKDDSEVFSDEQLDELSKISSQSDKFNLIQDQSKIVDVDRGMTKPVAFDTDIRRPSNNIKPKQSSQPDVSKVLEKDIKTPDKTSKSKKILKPAGIGLSIVALFLVGAYIWQVNYPTLAFKIASTKAGMSASMPGYIPVGYKLAGEIQTNPGSVSYNLVNGGQNKKISISQTKTDWDSQALAENYVAPKAENYLALQAQGLTIYMLGDSQATWVNKGTWYKIESFDQSLSQDQAIKIATSL